METIIETGKGPNGEQVELATVVFHGKPFTNLGAIIDKTSGRLSAYVVQNEMWKPGSSLARYTLQTFGGQIIARLYKTGESRGFYSSRITHFSAVIDGFRWHGKLGLDWSQLIHMKRGKKVQ